jgi:hypothetical protein
LAPEQPFTARFEVTNENNLFDVRDVMPSCHTVLVQTGRFTASNLWSSNQIVLPSLGPGEKTTTTCPVGIGGIGATAGAGNVTSAYMTMMVSYKTAWWPFTKTKTFPLKGVIDAQGGVHWTHITDSEMNAIEAEVKAGKS